VIPAGAATLRPWEPSDVSFVYFACQDDELRRWTRLPTPYRATHAAAFVTKHARPQPEETGAFFAITRTDTGELLGSISFSTIDWAGRRASVEYWLAPESRGQGFATAALDALIAWGSSDLGIEEVGLVVDADNPSAPCVARRAGFVPTESSTETSSTRELLVWRCARR
jgi:RimJ/RimL family protein N-acetyltransferase